MSSENAHTVPDFSATLSFEGLELKRDKLTTCQVNLGLVCNQACRHCHLSAGPGRKELMDLATIRQVVNFVKDTDITTVDITGGAPEMNPNLPELMDLVAELGKKMILRCNLSALYDQDTGNIQERLVRHRVNVTASLPSMNKNQTDGQRGDGIFNKSMDALKRLNDLGYGDPESGLELDLVSNPAGAFMPSPQASTEKRFKQILREKQGIGFNRLFTFANMPLGRFENWLKKSGNYEGYMTMLYKGFNPCTLPGLMCRNLVSVGWNGYLYDCDFNLAADIPLGNSPTHISTAAPENFLNREVAVGTHCYACTAGSGFT
ncbi:MAG: arsenosugar biosynthesis radical SAM protein ArsS [Desulfobacterales bacterium]|nr:arsenosugar biosynthesis radical SAM protein ArsS [Desulfobacterales bacterium]